jgi:hypothetical protein
MATDRSAAWIKGYLYGMGKPNIARALARNRTSEKVVYRRAALEFARALRNQKRVFENIR